MIRGARAAVVPGMNDFSPPTELPRRPRLPLLLALPLLLTGCSSLSVNDYAADTPPFDPFVFFDGRVHAWGIVQDWRGRVVRRFDVDIDGTVDDDVLTLDERFRYADGETDTRVWRIRAAGAAGSYRGTAGDILGEADGTAAGNALRWNYEMDLPVSGSTYRVRFDDWMWQLDDRVVVNRSYIRKFGLTVAEVTLFMQRSGG